MSGYSFALPGHVDPAGEAVWFRASQLDRGLSWSKVAPVLEAPAQAPAVVVPKRVLESTARHERRVEQAQAEAVAQQQEQRLAALPQVVAARVRGDDEWWAQRRRGGQQVGAAIVERGRLEKQVDFLGRLHQDAVQHQRRQRGTGKGSAEKTAQAAQAAQDARAARARVNRSVSDPSHGAGRGDGLER